MGCFGVGFSGGVSGSAMGILSLVWCVVLCIS